jgi:protein ImuA
MWSTGFESIDACLPDDGLSRAGLHEIEPLRATDMPSLTGFAFALLSRLRSNQAIIWCVTAQQIGDYGQPYAFGLERYGISPSQIIFAKVRHPIELQFALEEAVKTDGVAAVIGEGPRPSFTGSRRLSLLCRTHRRPCLLMSGKSDKALGSAALTRWQITPEQGVEDPHDPYGPGLPTWRVALPRARSGRTMPPMQADMPSQNQNTSYPWRIYWDDQTHSFHPAALVRNPAVHQGSASEHQTAKVVVGRRA